MSPGPLHPAILAADAQAGVGLRELLNLITTGHPSPIDPIKFADDFYIHSTSSTIEDRTPPPNGG